MSNTEPSVNTSTVTPASSQPDQITTTPQQKLLQEARAKLKLEHAENTQAVIDPSETESPVAPASSQPDQITTTPQQKVLQEARAKLKLEHAKKTQAVVDPSEETSPRVTGRQEAKAPKLHPAADIPTASTKTPWAKLSSSEQYLRQPEHPSVVPFYSQFEEVDRVRALLGQKPHAQVDSQASR